MKTLRPAGRIKIGTNIQLETATTDTKEEKLYLAESTTNSVVIIDAKSGTFEKVANVGLYPVGHAHHGQQGQLLPLTPDRTCRKLHGRTRVRGPASSACLTPDCLLRLCSGHRGGQIRLRLH